MDGFCRSEPARTAGADPKKAPPSVHVRCKADMHHEHDATLESLSIARCRELLGVEADTLSDPEIDEIGRFAETMADVIVHAFREQLGRQIANRNRRRADDLVDP